MPDDLIPEFLQLATGFSEVKKALFLKDISAGTNPMTLKKHIAKNIISQ
ncbi:MULTISPECIES: hypothetical protein [Bizionia]|nr:MULTISPECIES: hypothetical protein [Bizionia]